LKSEDFINISKEQR